MSENKPEGKNPDKKRAQRDQLRGIVLSSAANRDLEQKIVDEILGFIESLSEKQAAELVSLHNGHQEVSRDTKKIPRVINAKDPEKIGFAENALDLGEIKYSIEYPDITEIFLLLLTTKDGFAYVKKAANDQKDPLSAYWRQIANIIPSEKTKRPDNYPLMTTPVARKLRNGISNSAGRATIDAQQKIARKNKTIIINTRGELVYSDKKQEIVKPLDVSFISAIAALEKAGNKLITPDMIWRHAAQLPETAKVTAHQKTVVEESVARMMKTLYRIDATEEEKLFKSGIKETFIEQNALYLRKIGVGFVNGKRSVGWLPVYDENHNPILPALYLHATISGYICSVETESIGNIGVNMTEKTIPLRDALITEIHRLASVGNKGIKISYESLYPVADLGDNSTGTERQRVREQTKKILKGLNGRMKDQNGKSVCYRVEEYGTPTGGIELKRAKDITK